MDATVISGRTNRPAARRVASAEQLLARARSGDRTARDELVLEHLGLVRSVAAHYRDLGLPLEDLVQEGTIGLLAAIDDFDPRRGAAFGTFAYWRIRRSVTAALTANGRLLRLPKATIERRRVLAAARESCAADGHEPTVGELAATTGLATKAIVEALSAPAASASLDSPLPGGDPLESLVGDPAAPSPEAEALLDEQRHVLEEAVSHLPDRTRHVIEHHFGLGRDSETIASIASDLGLTPQRVRAIENSGLCALAHELEPALQENS